MTAQPDVLYWSTLFLFTSGALVLAILSWLNKSAWLIGASAGSLLVTLAIAALPNPHSAPLTAVLLSIGAIALAVAGGGPAAAATLELATKGSVKGGQHGGILVDSSKADSAKVDSARSSSGSVGGIAANDTADSGMRDENPREVLRGGLTIGLLERLAIVGSLIAGFPGALAVIVAIKGVGRFSELESAEARERFIIGTLASFIWACGSAGIAMLALH